MTDQDLPFEDIDERQVLQWLSSGQQEHLYLDFKTTGTPPFSGREDRKNFAIAVSGFANADGGVVVWAVQTERRDGVDRAVGIGSISDPATFLGQLTELTSSACSPPVPGVRHRILATLAGTIALTLVPRSDLAPHMARAGEDRYYRRAGSSFRVMEAYEVRDLLLRESAPVLQVAMKLRSRGSSGGGGSTRHQVHAVVSIVNTGRVSARAPFIEIEPNPPHSVHYYGVDGNGNFGLAPQVLADSNRARRFAGDGSTFLHPGVALDVASVEMIFHESHTGAVTHPAQLSVVCRLAAERFPLTESVLSASPLEIMRAAGKA